MIEAERVVLDTNVVVSGILFPGTVPARALWKAQAATVLASEAIRLEIADVLARARFDRYVPADIRHRLREEFIASTVDVIISHPIGVCRDPRHDKFLEAALHGRADLIVTGDRDLLALDPFHGIRIVTPAAFLARNGD